MSGFLCWNVFPSCFMPFRTQISFWVSWRYGLLKERGRWGGGANPWDKILYCIHLSISVRQGKCAQATKYSPNIITCWAHRAWSSVASFYFLLLPMLVEDYMEGRSGKRPCLPWALAWFPHTFFFGTFDGEPTLHGQRVLMDGRFTSCSPFAAQSTKSSKFQCRGSFFPTHFPSIPPR